MTNDQREIRRKLHQGEARSRDCLCLDCPDCEPAARLTCRSASKGRQKPPSTTQ
jgi:hypothetical protein